MRLAKGTRMLASIATVLVLGAIGCNLLLQNDPFPPDPTAADGGVDGSAEADAALPPIECPPDRATNTHHCGRCGHDCLGGACVASVCKPVRFATIQAQVDGIAVNASHLYWTSYHNGVIRRCSLPACAEGAQTIVAGEVATYGMAIDTTHVYWTRQSGGMNHAIRRCRLPSCDGGAVTMVDISYTGGTGPRHIALDTNRLYWTEAYRGDIGTCPLDAVDASGAALTTGQLNAIGIARSATTLFWVRGSSGSGDGSIKWCSLPDCNGGAGTLVQNLNDPYDLAVDDSFVYWTEQTTGSILRCTLPSCSGGPQTLAAGQKHPMHLVLHSGRLYWTNAGDNTPNTGSVVSCAAPNCESKDVLIANVPGANGLTVGEKRVFWSDEEGNVWGLALP
jgi:hypothetical protein